MGRRRLVCNQVPFHMRVVSSASGSALAPPVLSLALIASRQLAEVTDDAPVWFRR